MELDEENLFEIKNLRALVFQWHTKYFDLLPIFFNDNESSLVLVGGFVFLRQYGIGARILSEGDLIVKLGNRYEVFFPRDFLNAA